MPGWRRISDVAVLSFVRVDPPRQDRFTSRFVELTPPAIIVQAICFDSVDVAFTGEMTMVVTLENKFGGTEVTVLFENIPSGIRPEDNEAGTRSSLEKLARYVE
jgi:Activator of Hsp90 ATPase homolog 1-like protein